MNTKPKQTETQLDLWEKESLAWYSQKDLKKMVGRILKGKPPTKDIPSGRKEP
ncbi:MAG: hypothetical protein ACI8RA_001675 [Chlamydiales bacterium]|jgi:hypothetical protein